MSVVLIAVALWILLSVALAFFLGRTVLVAEAREPDAAVPPTPGARPKGPAAPDDLYAGRRTVVRPGF
jgi:hypothetical protein